MTRRGKVQIDAARQRHLAVARLHRLDRAVDGVQRTRTRGIHRKARSPEIEKVRHTVGDQRCGGAGRVMRLDRQITTFLKFLVVMIENTEYHADFPVRQAGGRDAGVFDARPGQLKHDALLGIHGLDDLGQQFEKLVVERVDVIDETAPLAVALVDFRFWIAPVPVPGPTLLRDLSDRRLVRNQVAPELVMISGVGQATRNTDNGCIHESHLYAFYLEIRNCRENQSGGFPAAARVAIQRFQPCGHPCRLCTG